MNWIIEIKAPSGSSAGPRQYLRHIKYAGEGRACDREEVED